ncbi:MAG: ArnT family glycosyltransferase [Tepidisphaeraceae bacterium]
MRSGASASICVGLVLAHAALLGWSAVGNSVTFDEYAHLPAGVAYWRYGEFSIYNLSPPLLRLWGAAPVMLSGPEIPPINSFLKQDAKDRHWNYAQAFERANRTQYQRLFVTARLAMIPISCVGVWIVWRWARELYGDRAGVAGAILYAFNPDLLAHGSLVGTDSGTAVAILAALYAWWRFCQQPTVGRAVLAAVLVALAHLCKFSALLLWPMMLAVWGCFLIADRTLTPALSEPAVKRRTLAALLICLVATSLGINLMYGYRGSFTPINSYSFRSKTLSAVKQHLPGWFAVPFPRDFVEGFDVQKHEGEGLYPAYILGQSWRGARWWFYPVALACKLPLGATALIALCFGSFFVRSGAWPPRRIGEAPLIAALVVFALGILLLADINIGVRYVLPAYPLACVLVSRLWGGAATAWLSAARSGLLVIAVVESLRVAPRFLTFVNHAASARMAAWHVVTDSNYDWGQGLLLLKQWMDGHGQRSIVLAYFGRVEPSVYGIEYTTITRPGDEPYVAISSYFLNGLEHRLATRDGSTGWVSLPYARALRDRRPVATVGNTILIFSREDVADAARAAGHAN